MMRSNRLTMVRIIQFSSFFLSGAVLMLFVSHFFLNPNYEAVVLENPSSGIITASRIQLKDGFTVLKGRHCTIAADFFELPSRSINIEGSLHIVSRESGAILTQGAAFSGFKLSGDSAEISFHGLQFTGLELDRFIIMDDGKINMVDSVFANCQFDVMIEYISAGIKVEGCKFRDCSITSLLATESKYANGERVGRNSEPDRMVSVLFDDVDCTQSSIGDILFVHEKEWKYGFDSTKISIANSKLITKTFLLQSNLGSMDISNSLIKSAGARVNTRCLNVRGSYLLFGEYYNNSAFSAFDRTVLVENSKAFSNFIGFDVFGVLGFTGVVRSTMISRSVIVGHPFLTGITDNAAVSDSLFASTCNIDRKDIRSSLKIPASMLFGGRHLGFIGSYPVLKTEEIDDAMILFFDNDKGEMSKYSFSPKDMIDKSFLEKDEGIFVLDYAKQYANIRCPTCISHVFEMIEDPDWKDYNSLIGCTDFFMNKRPRKE